MKGLPRLLYAVVIWGGLWLWHVVCLGEVEHSQPAPGPMLKPTTCMYNHHSCFKQYYDLLCRDYAAEPLRVLSNSTCERSKMHVAAYDLPIQHYNNVMYKCTSCHHSDGFVDWRSPVQPHTKFRAETSGASLPTVGVHKRITPACNNNCSQTQQII